MKKHPRNYATIGLIVIITVIITIAVLIGVSQQTNIHVDETNPSVIKNITVAYKEMTNNEYTITDMENLTYTTSERVYIGVKLNKSYKVSVQTYNNGSGYWIGTYEGVPDLSTKKRASGEIK